ncbi:Ribulokinase [compost metagenome]
MKLVSVTSSIADFRNDSKRCVLYILEQLKKEVWEAIGLFQGVAYEELKAEQLIVLILQDDIVEVDLRPSSDTPTHHLALYRSFVRNPEFTLVIWRCWVSIFCTSMGECLLWSNEKGGGTQMSKYTIGVDYGTESGRAVIVDLSDGAEIATHVTPYRHGVMDEVLPGADANWKWIGRWNIRLIILKC